MSEDRIQLLPQSQPYPLQGFVSDTHREHNNLPHDRSGRHVIFSHYDEVHSFQWEKEEKSLGRLDIWTTALMLCLLLLGIGCGIAHHAFNSYLDGKTTKSFDQAWAIRIGTALSMGFKTAILASMGMAFAQQVWKSVRRRAMTIKSLDSLFGAFAGDPRSLFQKDLYRSARLALFLAVCGWLLPIATVFTPATLRVKPMTQSSSANCLVSSLNLDNITDGGLIRYPSSNRLYTGPAPPLQRLAFRSLLTGSSARSAYSSSSSVGINTTYTISFTAPTLQCSQENSTTPPDFANLPQYTYWQGARSQMRDSNSGQDIPVMAIQYTSTPRTSAPVSLTCTPYIANYGVMVTHNLTDQTVTFMNMSIDSAAGRPAGGAAIQLTDNNARLTGISALVDATFEALTGTLAEDRNGTLLSTSSKIALASFVGSSDQSIFDFSQVPQRIEELMRNVVISAVGLGVTQIETACVTVDRANVYMYDQGTLLGAYIAAASVAIGAAGVGMYALKKNGHAGDTSFSGFILSTRNPTLDQACAGGRKSLLGLQVKFGTLRADGRPAFGPRSDF